MHAAGATKNKTKPAHFSIMYLHVQVGVAKIPTKFEEKKNMVVYKQRHTTRVHTAHWPAANFEAHDAISGHQPQNGKISIGSGCLEPLFMGNGAGRVSNVTKRRLQ